MLPIAREGRAWLRWTVATLPIACCFTPSTASAADPSTEQCLAAYMAGQRFRQAGMPKKAGEQFLLCLRDECPAALRPDCSAWLSETQKLTPSVVLGARDQAGHDLVAVAVLFDGQPLVQRLDGQPIDLDPGEHVLRFQVPNSAPVEQRLLLRAGEKARDVVVTIDVGVPAATPSGTSSSIPTTTWVFGGVAVASLGSAAYFFFSGLPTWERDHDGGGTSKDQSFVNTQWALTDVTGSVGLLSAALATYFYVSGRRLPGTVAPSAVPHGALMMVNATF
jgi:hypothetical protein